MIKYYEPCVPGIDLPGQQGHLQKFDEIQYLSFQRMVYCFDGLNHVCKTLFVLLFIGSGWPKDGSAVVAVSKRCASRQVCMFLLIQLLIIHKASYFSVVHTVHKKSALVFHFQLVSEHMVPFILRQPRHNIHTHICGGQLQTRTGNTTWGSTRKVIHFFFPNNFGGRSPPTSIDRNTQSSVHGQPRHTY